MSEPTETFHDCDVLVIGGGPGGSTAATLLARRGLKVVQLEKEAHPRFHIGESLLPMNLPIFDQLGVMEKVRELGVLKLGADFPVGKEGGYNTFYFRRALADSPPHAYQVKREDFDAMLFRHAAENGVDARERVKVEQITFLPERQVLADARNADGTAFKLRARYLVDASGRDTFLGNKFKLKEKNKEHQTAAIFGHFRQVERRPGEDAGNISIYRFEHGWAWMIPLLDGVMSVGCVCAPDYLKQRRGETEKFFFDTLKSMPTLWARMVDSTLISRVNVTGNYTYTCKEMAGPTWIMVGDAWAFVDPIFSSGVMLAMNSAVQASHLVAEALADPSREAALQKSYAKTMRKGVKAFSWFIYRFRTPALVKLFQEPRNFFGVEQGIISMLAGDVFRGGRVSARLHMFKVIYAAGWIANLRASLRAMFALRRQAKTEFVGGNTSQDSV